MKKVLSLTTALLMTCAVLTACGETADSTAETTTTTTTEATTTTAAPAETEETTTTTTTATEIETETTTETVEESAAETETTIAEAPEDTSSTDNIDGLYPLKEGFIKVIEDYTNQKVISIEDGDNYRTYKAILDDGEVFELIPAGSSYELFNTEELTDIADYEIYDSDSPKYNGTVLYAVPELF